MLDSIGSIPVGAAQKYGDKPALVCPERTLSFAELDRLTNRLPMRWLVLASGLAIE